MGYEDEGLQATAARIKALRAQREQQQARRRLVVQAQAPRPRRRNMSMTGALRWDVERILASRNRSVAAIAQEAGLHPYTLGQMDKGQAQRVALKTLAALATTLGVGVAPAPDGSLDPSRTLLAWQPDGSLAFRLRELRGAGREDEEAIRELFFETAIDRSTLNAIDEGRATQASVRNLAELCQHYNVALAGPPPGVVSSEWLLVWGTGSRRAPRPPVEDESPIPGQPSKICRCQLCLSINPEGVEKRIDAFPVSAKYKYGRGPICKAGRRAQEQARRQAKRQAEEAGDAAADPAGP